MWSPRAETQPAADGPRLADGRRLTPSQPARPFPRALGPSDSLPPTPAAAER